MIKKLLVAIVLMVGINIGANAAECSLYEQSHPAFLLDGSHLSTGKCSTCASCHRSGIFMGTPKSCVACHNGDPARITVGRSAGHIPTALIECNNCHNTTGFTTSVRMDHTAVTAQRCDSCHTSSYSSYGSRPKPREHVQTTADCLVCHSTRNWDVSHSKLHAGITTDCLTCHDGQTAVGKSSYALGHPTTSDQCELCHSIDASFKCASILDKVINFVHVATVNFKQFSGVKFSDLS
jgi:hypothetical protein